MSVIEAPQREYQAPLPPPNDDPKPTKRDVLHRAADLLEEFGWCQGALTNLGIGISPREAGVDRFCLSGAIGRAVYDLLGFSEGSAIAWARILHDLGGIEAVSWNDAPGRTKEEVVTKLREAAEA